MIVIPEVVWNYENQNCLIIAIFGQISHPCMLAHNFLQFALTRHSATTIFCAQLRSFLRMGTVFGISKKAMPLLSPALSFERFMELPSLLSLDYSAFYLLCGT